MVMEDIQDRLQPNRSTRHFHVARSLWYHLRATCGGLQPCHLGRVAQGVVVYRVGLDLPSLANPQIFSKTGRWKQKNFWYSKVLPLFFCLKWKVILGAHILHLLLLGDFGYYYLKHLGDHLVRKLEAIRTWKLGTVSFLKWSICYPIHPVAQKESFSNIKR